MKTATVLFAYYQIDTTFAVEVSYRRLVDADGSIDGNNYSVKTDQASVSVLGSIAVADNVRLFTRVGVNHLSAKARGDISATESATRLLLGAGVSYSFSDTVSARLELQRPVKDLLNLSAWLSRSASKQHRHGDRLRDLTEEFSGRHADRRAALAGSLGARRVGADRPPSGRQAASMRWR
ncbi:porin family protein [Massilia sp. B-10]|nr:porin family protein [Massilia sp. B-10]